MEGLESTSMVIRFALDDAFHRSWVCGTVSPAM